MTIRHYHYYVAIIEHSSDPNTRYGIFFPDLPGCTASGETEQEAAVNAEAALRGYVNHTLDVGEKLPHPTPLEDIAAKPDVTEVARILLRCDMRGRAKRINVTIDEALLGQIDAAAESEGVNRSKYLALAARDRIAAA